MGRPAGDHRLRDRVRHRAARAAPVPLMPGRLIRTAGLAAGIAATFAGAAYTAERVAASRLRRHDDEDLAADLVPPFDEIRSLPSPDEGSISVISRGEGPPIVLSHGVTLSVRTWVKQMQALPEAGFRTV